LTNWAIAFCAALESSICGIGISCGVCECGERRESDGWITTQFARDFKYANKQLTRFGCEELLSRGGLGFVADGCPLFHQTMFWTHFQEQAWRSHLCMRHRAAASAFSEMK
jgi:hypothetical protein